MPDLRARARRSRSHERQHHPDHETRTFVGRAGASSVRLDDLQNLPHGLYVVQVRYSDGQTQRLKLIKE